MTSEPELRLRPAGPEDEPFLDDLYATTREREMALVPWPEEAKREFLRQQARAQRADYRRRFPDSELRIVEVDGRAAGRLHVDRGEVEIRLIDVSLAPEHRGHGIGTRLLGALLEEADRTGLAVALHVELSNPARRLYERLGFEPCGDDGVYASMTRSARVPSRPGPADRAE